MKQQLSCGCISYRQCYLTATPRAILRIAAGESPNLHNASQCWRSSENRM